MRLHGIDENNAGEVAGLLAYFRALQRQLDLSVMLVHHTRKNAAGGVAAGQGLRGSGDLHAFGDSNLYLRRTKDRLLLVQRAPRRAGFAAGLSGTGGDRRADHPPGDRRRSSTASSRNAASRSRCWRFWPTGAVLTRAKLRDTLGVKNERLGEALESLEQAGRLRRTPDRLATHRLTPSGPFPFPL